MQKYKVHILSKFYFFPAHQELPSLLRGRLSSDGRIRPYYTREEIDVLGRLKGRGLELLWVDNPVDLFFLHIQGSGVVLFEDGRRRRIGYSDSNGHPYRAIGRILIERGVLTYENMSMQSIRKYLGRHSEEVQALFNENPSYIFFSFLRTGPLGSTHVPITPFRSVATDPRLFPPGALCYLRTDLPLPGRYPKAKQDSLGWLTACQGTEVIWRGAASISFLCCYRAFYNRGTVVLFDTRIWAQFHSSDRGE